MIRDYQYEELEQMTDQELKTLRSKLIDWLGQNSNTSNYQVLSKVISAIDSILVLCRGQPLRLLYKPT